MKIATSGRRKAPRRTGVGAGIGMVELVGGRLCPMVPLMRMFLCSTF